MNKINKLLCVIYPPVFGVVVFFEMTRFLMKGEK